MEKPSKPLVLQSEQLNAELELAQLTYFGELEKSSRLC